MSDSTMKGSAELPDPVSEVLEDTVDEARINRIWAGMEARPAARPSPVIWAVPLVAAAAAVALFWGWPSPPAATALTLASGGALVEIRTDDAPETVRLADGSRVRLSPNSALSPVENDGETVRWRLAEGEARFEVQPNGPRRWVVDGGAATATVLGTVFTVRRESAWTEVEVERGRVRVDAVSGTWTLARGERRAVGERGDDAPEDRRDEAALAGGPEPEVTRVDETVEAPTPRATPRPAPPRARTASELLEAADAARQSGETDRALDLLRRAASLDGADAALAAFTLGRMLAPGEPAAAAQAFERALVLPLPVRLAEDASARRVEAWAAAGDDARATSAARAYLVRYPEGRHADRVRARVERP